MTPRQALERSRSQLGFLGEFLRAHGTIGAVAPTSRRTAARIARLAGIADTTAVAELGPGTGAITHELLAALPHDGTLVAFEVYPPFLTHLRATVDDPRFTLLAQSATEIRGVHTAPAKAEPGFDAIVSSLPFSLMGTAQTTEIVRCVAQALRPNGVFVALQYHPRYLRPFLLQAFETVEWTVYPWNVPPVLLLTARRARLTE